MSFQRLKSFLQQTETSKVKYHFYKHGLFIKANVIKVDIEDDHIDIRTAETLITIENTFTISNVRRPANLITDCEACFQIKNDYDDQIGYLYC